MTCREVLFDTNAYIAFANRDLGLLAALPEIDKPVIAFATLGELYTGIFRSTRKADNLRVLKQSLQDFSILYPDFVTTIGFGEVDALLRRKGRHASDNDIWIAALALQHQLPLITRDRDFVAVEGLELVVW